MSQELGLSRLSRAVEMCPECIKNGDLGIKRVPWMTFRGPADPLGRPSTGSESAKMAILLVGIPVRDQLETGLTSLGGFPNRSGSWYRDGRLNET